MPPPETEMPAGCRHRDYLANRVGIEGTGRCGVDVAAANHASPMVAAGPTPPVALSAANSGYFFRVTLTFEPAGRTAFGSRDCLITVPLLPFLALLRVVLPSLQPAAASRRLAKPTGSAFSEGLAAEGDTLPSVVAADAGEQATRRARTDRRRRIARR